ncbi:MAG: hypothetical protein KKE73_09195 [Proteobacteria bacterium]|nr:hypothetical protein [Pseudomonadota bacterium]
MEIATDHKCPHCEKILEPWEGPPETGWGLILVCNNNQCPYFSCSNETVAQYQPDSKVGFRYAEDPNNNYISFNLASYCGSSFMDLVKQDQ